jgi:hypothetical protein
MWKNLEDRNEIERDIELGDYLDIDENIATEMDSSLADIHMNSLQANVEGGE